LEVFYRSSLVPDDDVLRFLQILAGQIAIAIDSNRLYEDLRLANIENLKAYEAAIEGWSRAMDLRDKETEGHTQRVTVMTLALARTLGMPEQDLVHIRRGALLHDIGKLIELEYRPHGSRYTPAGRLIGHILLGRDLVREHAARIEDLNPETLLRLEHMIVSHQNLPEWGSPIAPHTPEALLVHYADDIDAKFYMMASTLENIPPGNEDALRRSIFLGLKSPEST